MASTSDLKNGLVLKIEGQLWSVVEFQHVKPGKGPAFVRTKLKNILSGKVVDKTFNAGVSVEIANVDKRSMQYLYRDGDDWVFMDTDTYDQYTLDNNVVGDGFDFDRDWGAQGSRSLAPSTNVATLALTSRTVRAGGVGIAGLVGILQNWWNELIHYAIPPADGIQGLVDQTQASVATAKQVASMANINIEHIMLWIALAIFVYIMCRRGADKQEQVL